MQTDSNAAELPFVAERDRVPTETLKETVYQKKS
jgi:hypothetical protein